MKWMKAVDCGISKWADLVETGDGGVKVCRIPDYWLDRIARCVTPKAKEPSGVQLNFKTNSSYVVFEMMSEGAADAALVVSIFVNDTLHEYTLKPAPTRQRIELSLAEAGEKCVKAVLPISFETTLYDLGFDADAWVAPVQDSRKTICFVGDSITQGAKASKSIATYPYLAAEQLSLNYINMGKSGACFPDPVMAIYLSTQVEWDFLSIAMGTNSFGRGHESAEEYEIMYGAFLDIVRANRKEKPILCITPIWRGNADGEGKSNARGVTLEELREAIRRAVWTRQEEDANLYLLEGTTLISDSEGLSADHLHPDDRGMQMMAEGIAAFLKQSRIF